MGAFPQDQLFNHMGRDLCPLCQKREQRKASREADTAPRASGEPLAPAPGHRFKRLPDKKTSGWAIASLILAFLLPLGIPSLVAGVVALRQISSRREELEGRGLAIGGIVLSFVGLACLACFLAALVAAASGLEEQRTLMRENVAANNLGLIAKVQEVYYAEYGEYGELGDLLSEGLLPANLNAPGDDYVYSVEVVENGDSYSCRATPNGDGAHFFVDGSGLITRNENGPADENSREFSSHRMPYRPSPTRRVRPRSGG
jgi:hypothetical protein